MRNFAGRIAGLVFSLVVAQSATATCKNHYILTLPDPCLSAPGQLDPGFGDGGLALLKSGFVGVAAATQTDGKILVSGTTTNAATGDFVGTLFRLTENGALDPTFGIDGQVQTAFGELGGGMANVLLLPDGKMVVAGSALVMPDPRFMQVFAALTLARYWPDGRLDQAFGNGGKVVTRVGDFNAYPASLTLQAEGKILVSARSCDQQWEQCRFAAVRYRNDGELDRTFGNDGSGMYVTPSINRGFVAMMPDGSLVASFLHQEPGREYDPYRAGGLAKFRHDGSLDTSFGSGGTVVTPFEANAVSIGADGNIVILGSSRIADPRHARITLARFTANGVLDPTFGDAGIAAYAFPSGAHGGSVDDDQARSLEQQPDGKWVAVAGSGDLDASTNILLARYTRNGALDRTFNGTGYARLSTTGAEWPYGLHLQPDGKVLVLGDVHNATNAVIRYRGNQVVEFYNSVTDRYFLTVDPDEQASVALGGSGPGWVVTGETFGSNAPVAACRFASVGGAGSDSHFFTLDARECQHVKADAGWKFEGYDFSAHQPDASGECAAGTQPIYRVYNNGYASNASSHRYAKSMTLYQSLVAHGWTAEGVVFCVPN